MDKKLRKTLKISQVSLNKKTSKEVENINKDMIFTQVST